MDITNNEITESQLDELDTLLLELQKSSIHDKSDFVGDDELMIASITNAARYANGEENTFLEDIVHIKSSYKNTK